MNFPMQYLTAKEIRESFESVQFGRFRLGSKFQPIVSPVHRRVVGYEALARPDVGGDPVSPGVLFDEAASLNTMPELDLVLWQSFLNKYASIKPNSWLFLNLSAESVVARHPSPARLAALVRMAGLCCSRIVMEIVEEAVSDQESLEQFVQGCRAEGFRTAIDDFGAGDAHFERVWRIRPDIVKMDRTMVVAAAENPRAAQIMRSLIRMIRENGSLVLIEGIETEAEAKVAWESDADLYQGFWFSVPSEQFEQGGEKAKEALEGLRERLACVRFQQEQELKDYLSNLRDAMLWACGELAVGRSLALASCALFSDARAQRCYLLDESGVQIGETICPMNPDQTLNPDFNPLFEASGASWAQRDYFTNALESPGVVCLSRPYVGLPDTVRTVTASCMVRTAIGVRVLCADLHPETAFPNIDCVLPAHI